jgi:hypothetical protein
MSTVKVPSFNEILAACGFGTLLSVGLYGCWAPHDLIRILNHLI